MVFLASEVNDQPLRGLALDKRMTSANAQRRYWQFITGLKAPCVLANGVVNTACRSQQVFCLHYGPPCKLAGLRGLAQRARLQMGRHPPLAAEASAERAERASRTADRTGLAADLRSQADRRSPSLRSGERLQADLSAEE